MRRAIWSDISQPLHPRSSDRPVDLEDGLTARITEKLGKLLSADEVGQSEPRQGLISGRTGQAWNS